MIERCSNQVRTGYGYIAGLDFVATMKISDSLGYDPHAMAELLPSCETGLLRALNKREQTEGDVDP